MRGPKSFRRMTSRGKMECSVVLLDNSLFTTEFPDKIATGQELLTKVLEHVNDIDGEYFGLQFMDVGGELNWLDPTKQIKGQRSKPYNFQFAVRFFPRNISILKEKTLLQLRMQIKDSLLRGKICCTVDQHAIFDSYYVQAVLGDYNPKVNLGCVYLSEQLGSQVIEPNGINCDVEADEKVYKRKVAKLHSRLKGMTSSEATNAYIEFAKALPLYGCPTYRSTDSNGNAVILAVTEDGISVYDETLYHKPGKLQLEFSWDQIVTTVCQYKRFCILSHSTDPAKNGSFSFKFHGSYGNVNALHLQVDVTDFKSFFYRPDKKLNRRSKSFSEKDSAARISSVPFQPATSYSLRRRNPTGGKPFRRFTSSVRRKVLGHKEYDLEQSNTTITSKVV